MKNLLKLLLVGAIIGGGIAYYLWNKPHENMDTIKADFEITAVELFKAFNDDETAADAKFLGKTIAVNGTVKEVSDSEGTTKVQLDAGEEAMFGVLCELDNLTTHQRTKFEVGETVIFKGKCSGFNLDVQLSRCVEVK